eukprot:1152096-Pelagomonas_calceolata.AAC.3
MQNACSYVFGNAVQMKTCACMYIMARSSVVMGCVPLDSRLKPSISEGLALQIFCKQHFPHSSLRAMAEDYDISPTTGPFTPFLLH